MVLLKSKFVAVTRQAITSLYNVVDGVILDNSTRMCDMDGEEIDAIDYGNGFPSSKKIEPG